MSKKEKTPLVDDEVIEQELEQELEQEGEQAPKEPYQPRPLGFRIFALALAALVIIGLILWYYNIFTAGK